MPDIDNRIKLDSSDVRVTEWRLQPGAATERRRHDCDLITIPLSRGLLRLVSASEERIVEAVPGAIIMRGAPLEQYAVNEGDVTINYLEIELKGTTRRLISG